MFQYVPFSVQGIIVQDCYLTKTCLVYLEEKEVYHYYGVFLYPLQTFKGLFNFIAITFIVIWRGNSLKASLPFHHILGDVNTLMLFCEIIVHL